MEITTILKTLYPIVVFLVCCKIIYESKQPARTYALLLLIIFLPVVGLVIYYFFAKDYRKDKMYSKKLISNIKAQDRLAQYLKEHEQTIVEEFPDEYERFEPISKLVFADNHSLLTNDNKINLLINGEEKFPLLKDDLLQATDHIHMQYFIFEDDKMGAEIGEILAQKAEAGVDVRVLYDYFGSIDLKNKNIRAIEERGVKVAPFHKLGFKTSLDRMNYRNHRKIVVIDGRVGYTGGLNISNDYINDENYPSKHYWRDTHIRTEGKSVWSLQQLFMTDWNFAYEDCLEPSEEFFPPVIDHSSKNTWMQVVNSGPDSNHESILNAYIEAILAAEESIHLATPYFIPPIEFTKALKMAALKGLDIKLLVPEHSDSWYANTAARSNYSELLDLGVEIYFYQRGMFHAKTMVCDRIFSTVGTANLDFRSFDLNFEVNALIWDKEFAEKMIKSFETDLDYARRVDPEVWEQRPMLTKFFEKLMALFSPLL